MGGREMRKQIQGEMEGIGREGMGEKMNGWESEKRGKKVRKEIKKEKGQGK